MTTTMSNVTFPPLTNYSYYFLNDDDKITCPVTDQRLPRLWNKMDFDFDWRGLHSTVSFQNTRPIIMGHEWRHRYGKPDNIELLWKDVDTDTRRDYIVGVAAVCITVIVVFAIWMLGLIVLKYMGPEKVGFWSGKFEEAEIPPSSSLQNENDEPSVSSMTNNDSTLLPLAVDMEQPPPPRGSTQDVVHSNSPDKQSVPTSFADKMQSPFAIFDLTLLQDFNNLVMEACTTVDDGRHDPSTQSQEQISSRNETSNTNNISSSVSNKDTTSNGNEQNILVLTSMSDEDARSESLRAKSTEDVDKDERSSSSSNNSSEKECANHRNQNDTRTQNDDDEFTDRHQAKRLQRRRVRITQALVIASGTGIIVSAILMAVLGVNALLNTMKQMMQTFQQVDRLAKQGVALMDATITIIEMGENHTGNITASSPIYNVLVYTQGQVCGGVAVETVCQQWIDAVTANTPGGIGNTEKCLDEWGRLQRGLGMAMEDLFDIMHRAMQTLLNEMQGVRSDLVDLIDFVDGMEKQINGYEWVLAFARAINLILAGLCFLIVLGLFYEWPRLVQCLQHWITLPLFSFLVVLSSILSMLCTFSATVLADFCINGPDVHVLSIINHLDVQLSDLVNEFVHYYINQCPLE
jgi:hypothetical protein